MSCLRWDSNPQHSALSDNADTLLLYCTCTCTVCIKKNFHTVSFNRRLNGLTVEKNGRATVESTQWTALTVFKTRTRRGVKTGSSGITTSFLRRFELVDYHSLCLRKALSQGASGKNDTCDFYVRNNSLALSIFTCVTNPLQLGF